jgi:hypothetical protein
MGANLQQQYRLRWRPLHFAKIQGVFVRRFEVQKIFSSRRVSVKVRKLKRYFGFFFLHESQEAWMRRAYDCTSR